MSVTLNMAARAASIPSVRMSHFRHPNKLFKNHNNLRKQTKTTIRSKSGHTNSKNEDEKVSGSNMLSSIGNGISLFSHLLSGKEQRKTLAKLQKDVTRKFHIANFVKEEEKKKYCNDNNSEVFEINNNILVLGDQIGKGANKIVKKGLMINENNHKEVAVLTNKVKRSFLDKVLKERSKSKVCEVAKNVLFEVDQQNKYKDHPNIEDPPFEKGIFHSPDCIDIIRIVSLAKGSLEKLLTGDMTLSKVLSIVADAAAGLDGMHQSGEVHSDIKPQNILITKDNVGQLSDLEMTGKEGDKSKGATDAYLENGESGKGRILTKESDIYALGLTLKDITNHSEWYDSSNREHLKIMEEIDELTKQATCFDRAKRPTAWEFAVKLAEIAKKADSLGFKPLGSINLQEKVAALAEARNHHARCVNEHRT